jgi:hypothetical protein
MKSRGLALAWRLYKSDMDAGHHFSILRPLECCASWMQGPKHMALPNIETHMTLRAATESSIRDQAGD